MPEDYFDARTGFRSLAEHAGATLHAHSIAATGPRGEILTIDTAYLGAARPARLAILTSGAHGVEGFAGNALQRLWLTDFADSLPPDTGALLVHAVNPFGFAHGRRMNENNVDLNRNALVQFPGPDNREYARLDDWLNPSTPADSDGAFWAQGMRWLLTLGPARLRQVIAAGQYAYPQGLFYGGRERQESLQILETVLRSPFWQAVETVLHLDMHTGLGRWRDYRLLLSDPPGSPRPRTFSAWFDARHVTCDAPGDVTHYVASGTLPELTARAFPGARVLAATLEFGTYSPLRILRALRAENRLHHHGTRDPQVAARIRAELREVFYPADATWRTALIGHGAEIFGRLRTALALRLK